MGSMPLEDRPCPALPRLGSATRDCGGLGPGHAAPTAGQGARSRHKRKQKRICMPRLHPALTKLPADEQRRTSSLLPNLWQEKQGGVGEGE